MPTAPRPGRARMRPGDRGRMRAAPAPADGWTSRYVTVRGVATHCRVRPGPGTPVVLVHGLAVSHRYLMPTAYPLSAAHPVLVPDLPGYGLSAAPGPAYDVAGHAAHLAALLDALAPGPAVLLGHSFGAEVAARLARVRPDLAAALVLAGPTADPAARTRRGQLGRWLADLVLEDPRQAGVLARDVRDAGPRRIVATLGHSVRNRIEDDVRRVGVPVLVVGGSRDPVAPGRWRAALAAAAPCGRHHSVPGAGHNVATTAGPRVAAAVTAFAGAWVELP